MLARGPTTAGIPDLSFLGELEREYSYLAAGIFFKNREVICKGARCRVVIDFHNLMHIRRLFLGALETRQRENEREWERERRETEGEWEISVNLFR